MNNLEQWIQDAAEHAHAQRTAHVIMLCKPVGIEISATKDQRVKVTYLSWVTLFRMRLNLLMPAIDRVVEAVQ